MAIGVVGLTPGAKRTTITQGQGQTDRLGRENSPNDAVNSPALPTGAALAPGKGFAWCPSAFRNASSSAICFLAFVVVAYLFGLLVLT